MNGNKIKVAIVHNIVSPYRVALFEQLAKDESLDLHVYYSTDTHKERGWKVDAGEGYDFEILGGRPLELGPIVFNWSPSIFFKLLGSDYDMVIIGGMSDLTSQLAALAAKIRGQRCLVWSEGIESSTSKLGRLVGPLVRGIIRRSDGVIVSGSASYKFHHDMGVPAGKLTVAPDAVDNAHILEIAEKYADREALRMKLGFTDKKVILFVGQMIPRKGPDHLLDAFISLKKKIPEAVLVMVGDGPMRADLEKKCREQNVQDVILTGWLDEDQKTAQYRAADLFVLPTHEDVWGLVINEAMTMGLPILTTEKAGAHLDLIREINGRAIPDANEQVLCEALNDLLKDGSSLREMGRHSREIIMGEFRIDQEAKGFSDAIKKALP